VEAVIKGMRWSWTPAIVATGLVAAGTVGTVAAAGTSARLRTAGTVVAHVENLARLPMSDVEGAERIVGRTLQDAAVAIEWAHDAEPPAEMPRIGDMHIRVRLLGGAPPGRIERRGDRDDVLGFATADAGSHALVAYVLADRVAAKASVGRYPVAWLLGDVMAHEVGHLLLPSGYGHSNKGVMRPQVQARIGAAPRFTDEEAALIRQRARQHFTETDTWRLQ